jgi:hypothetical protein
MKKSRLLFAALAVATHAGAAYKCVDEKGLTHIGDTPPAGCANVLMHEVSRNGQILRSIEPTMTPEQLRAKEEAAAKKLEADRAAAEQKRKDTALLSTFSSEKEFDVVRDRNIEPLKARIKTGHERIKAADKRISELDEEMEFYKAGKSGKGKKEREPPRMLLDEQERLKAEKVSIGKSITASEKEIDETRAKFDTDKRRWVALKSGTRTIEAPAPKPVAGVLGPGAAGKAKCGDKVYECPAGQTYACKVGRTVTMVNCVVER